MTKAGDKILAGLKEALAIAKGEAEPARVHYPRDEIELPDDLVERAWNEITCHKSPNSDDAMRAAGRVFVEWEREQCARAAIDWQRSYSLDDCCDIAQDAACEAIAAAIRARSRKD